MTLSLWLTFANPLAHELQTLISDLATENGTPVFVPHATVLGDIDLSLNDAAQLAETIAPAFFRTSAKVAKLGTGATFFQSVFFELILDPTAASMRASLLRQFEKSPAYPPHVSLAYGIENPSLLKDQLDQVNARFIGSTLPFHSLVVMASSEDRPVDSWRPLHRVALDA